MTRHIKTLVLAGTGLLTLAACSTDPVSMRELKANGQYWQRSSVSEATYMEGPKVQQMLFRDISRCVTELREMDRLGAIRQATPGETREDGTYYDPITPEGRLAQWDTPERDGYLLAEHVDYHDFETCMQNKGWERVEYLPYDQAQKSREDYIEAVTGQRYRSKVGERPSPIVPPKSPYEDLND